MLHACTKPTTATAILQNKKEKKKMLQKHHNKITNSKGNMTTNEIMQKEKK